MSNLPKPPGKAASTILGVTPPNLGDLLPPESASEYVHLVGQPRGLRFLYENVMAGSLSLSRPLGDFSALVDRDAATKEKELNEKIASLRTDLSRQADELRSERSVGAEKTATVESLLKTVAALEERERFNFLLSRVNNAARTKLLKSEEFGGEFTDGQACDAFVMSVDIRRSTELMLKARSPQQFARFITTICRELENIVKENYGVFDKFTGDGVLAFFPDFFAGRAAGYFAMRAAEQCHSAFSKQYRDFRSSFTSVLSDVGLGIGIDYGPTHLFQVAGGLTVVGAPVVYACRMSGAQPGKTLLNQPGYERISKDFSEYCFFRETELEIKREGKTLAYEANLNAKEFSPALPEWNDNHQPSGKHEPPQSTAK